VGTLFYGMLFISRFVLSFGLFCNYFNSIEVTLQVICPHIVLDSLLVLVSLQIYAIIVPRETKMEGDK